MRIYRILTFFLFNSFFLYVLSFFSLGFFFKLHPLFFSNFFTATLYK